MNKKDKTILPNPLFLMEETLERGLKKLEHTLEDMTVKWEKKSIPKQPSITSTEEGYADDYEKYAERAIRKQEARLRELKRLQAQRDHEQDQER